MMLLGFEHQTHGTLHNLGGVLFYFLHGSILSSEGASSKPGAVHLSSPDLMDIQARALEEGIPYQTLIASVLHKYLSGRLIEKPFSLIRRSPDRAD